MKLQVLLYNRLRDHTIQGPTIHVEQDYVSPTVRPTGRINWWYCERVATCGPVCRSRMPERVLYNRRGGQGRGDPNEGHSVYIRITRLSFVDTIPAMASLVSAMGLNTRLLGPEWGSPLLRTPRDVLHVNQCSSGGRHISTERTLFRSR